MNPSDDLYKHYTLQSKSLPIEPGYPETEQRPKRSRKKSTSESQQRDHMEREIGLLQVKAAGYVMTQAMALWIYLEQLPGSDQPRHDVLLRPITESLVQLLGILAEKDRYVHSLTCEERCQTVRKPRKKLQRGKK